MQSNKVMLKLETLAPHIASNGIHTTYTFYTFTYAFVEWLSNESNDEYSAVYLKSYLMALSDCYDCELDFVKKEILHTRSVFEGLIALSCLGNVCMYMYVLYA